MNSLVIPALKTASDSSTEVGDLVEPRNKKFLQFISRAERLQALKVSQEGPAAVPDRACAGRSSAFDLCQTLLYHHFFVT